MTESSAPLPTAAEAALPPLKPEDFDALDDALDAMREHDEDVPQWEFCDGFMTALVCTRRPIEPTEYWPALFGAGFSPAQHMEFVWRWKRRGMAGAYVSWRKPRGARSRRRKARRKARRRATRTSPTSSANWPSASPPASNWRRAAAAAASW